MTLIQFRANAERYASPEEHGSPEYARGDLFRRQQQQHQPSKTTESSMSLPTMGCYPPYSPPPPPVILSPQHQVRSFKPIGSSPFTVDSMLSPTPSSKSTNSGRSSPSNDFTISTSPPRTDTNRQPSDTRRLTPKGAPKTPKSKRKRVLQPPISPSLSPSAAPKRRNVKPSKSGAKRTRWSEDETTILVEVYTKWADRLRHDKKQSVWQLIKKQYELRCKQDNVKTNKEVPQIKHRIEYLVSTYKQIRDNNNQTGRGKENFVWYDKMSAILDKRSSVIPTNVSEVLTTQKKSSKSCKPSSTITSTRAQDENEMQSSTQDDLFSPTEDGEVTEDATSGHVDPPVVNAEDDSDNDENDQQEPPPSKKPLKRMSKQAAFAELVDTLKTEMTKHTEEVKLQNEKLKESADADRAILKELTDSCKRDSEINAQLVSVLAELVKKD